MPSCSASMGDNPGCDGSIIAELHLIVSPFAFLSRLLVVAFFAFGSVHSRSLQQRYFRESAILLQLAVQGR